MKQEKVHDLEQNSQAKIEGLTVFPLLKKKSTKMKQEKVHQLQEKFHTKVEKLAVLPASVKTKPKQQQQQQQKKQFYELYDETRKNSPTVRKFPSKSREVDSISNIKNNSMELRMKQEKSSPT